MDLRVDQQVDAVSSGETCDGVGSVFPYPTSEVACHAHIERPVSLAREDVDASSPHDRPCDTSTTSWVPAFAGMTKSKLGAGPLHARALLSPGADSRMRSVIVEPRSGRTGHAACFGEARRSHGGGGRGNRSQPTGRWCAGGGAPSTGRLR